MQTFLPYPDFAESARTLDRARLGKQRIEVKQLLRTRMGESDGWINHPAYLMWEGSPVNLAKYGIEIAKEWINRGYDDNTLPFFESVLKTYSLFADYHQLPRWIGDENFHRSHRANLVRKMPEHYVPLFGNLSPEPYVWPIRRY